MNLMPEKGRSKKWYDCACRFSLRHILFLFIFLLFLVTINLFASSSKLNLVLDVSLRMKSDFLDAINSFVDIKQADSINGSFSIRSVLGEDLKSQDGLKRRQGLMLNEVTLQDTKDKRIIKNDPMSNPTPWYLQSHPGNQSQRTIKVSNDFGIDFQQKGDGTKTLSKKFAKFPHRDETDANHGEIQTQNNTAANGIVMDNNIRPGDNWRKDACDTCFQHNFNYVIDNPDVCKLTSSTETVDILILILTIHKNIKARNALRDTWLSPIRNNTGNIRHVFLLGETQDQELREQVRQENNEYRDIIKEDFVDSYMNLTYKTVMGFKWASTKCPHARFVLKTDDDMYVNTNNLLTLVNTHTSALQTAIGGACNLKARPIRNKNSKWYASVSSYPNAHYPGFCSGTGYVTSMAVVQRLYDISPNVPFFHLEDVYVALCIRKLGFSLKPIPGFNVSRPRLDPCVFKGPKLVTAHRMLPVMLQMVWRRNCVLKYGNRVNALVKRRTR